MFKPSRFRLGIKPLWIAPDTFLERSVNEDFKKSGGCSQFSHHLPFGAKWRDKRADYDQPRFGHQLGHLADAPDVFDTVRIGEPKITVEPMAYIVAVEQHRVPPASQQLLLNEVGDRRFPG